MQSTAAESSLFFSAFGGMIEDPRPEDLTLGEASGVTIDFGQHKGTTVGELVRRPVTREYLKYLVKWPELKLGVKNAITRMLDAHAEYQAGLRAQKAAFAMADLAEAEQQ